jgi:cytochrome c
MSFSTRRSRPIPSLLALSLLGGASTAFAQIDHGCPPAQSSEFRMVPLVTRTNGDLMEPMKIDFDMDAQGNVDVYYVERKGRVSKYDAKTKAVVRLGRIAYQAPQTEHGLTGIALAPDFKQSRNIYFFYSKTPNQLVTRITLNGAGELDMNTEKTIIQWPVQSGWHSGGAMKFDAEGNLWIAVGENNAPDAGAANTNDLRGKILRIKPKPDASGYDVPEGNLFPKGTAQTKPEIYIMGVRNPYTLNYDNKTKRVVWGCVGPDGYGLTEEHNMTSTPGNFGWPYFAGQNRVIRSGKDPLKPINNGAGNTGLQELPPARPSINTYNQAAAMTGPIYRYSNAPSAVKLPPHFDGVWFVTDYSGGRSTVDTVGVNAAGTQKTAQVRVMTGIKLNKPLDFQQGPDGALYVVNYGGPDFSYGAATTIDRIEYTGSCRPVVVRHPGRSGGPSFQVNGFRVTVEEAMHSLRITDLAGREVFRESYVKPAVHDLAPLMRDRSGIHLLEVQSPSGRRVVRLAH